MSENDKIRQGDNVAEELSLILAAIRELLTSTLSPNLTGYEKYSARVASNALGIVERHHRIAPELQKLDRDFLPVFDLPEGSDVEALTKKIWEGEVQNRSQLIDYLKRRTLLQMEIDNPNYWGYREALKKWNSELK